MDSRRAWIGMAVASTALALCGWTAANWKDYARTTGSQSNRQDSQFRIAFPRSPTESQESTTASDGSRFVSNRLTSSPSHGVSYALDWWENPSQKEKSTDELFADFRDCYINVFRGSIVSEKEANVQGNPAKDTVRIGTQWPRRGQPCDSSRSPTLFPLGARFNDASRHRECPQVLQFFLASSNLGRTITFSLFALRLPHGRGRPRLHCG